MKAQDYPKHLLFALAGAAILFLPHLASADCSIAEYVIVNDATGGDCTSIGDWDASTRTCKLDTTVIATSDSAIEIDGNGITLDCAANSIFADDCDGVLASGQSGITVKNCIIQEAQSGFDFSAVTGAHIVANIVGGSYEGAELNQVNRSYFIKNQFDVITNGFDMEDSHNNHFINNTARFASDNFDIDDSSRNHFIGNKATDGGEGFDINDARGNYFIQNDASNNSYDGFNVGSKSRNNRFLFNTAFDNGYDGFFASGAKNNQYESNITGSNGEHGMHDDTSGNGTAGTANTYINNICPDGNEQAGPGEICED